MKRHRRRLLAGSRCVLAFGASLAGAVAVPEISVRQQRRSAEDAGRHVFVGEVGGVGQNSKGQIFVYTRTGPSVRDARRQPHVRARRLAAVRSSIETGKFERELGQDVYGFNAAIGLRVDPQDNVWTIDEAASQVVKFDPEGRVALVLGRKPEAINVRPARPAADAAVRRAAAVAAAERRGARRCRGGGGRGGGRRRWRRRRARVRALRARRSTVRPTSRGIGPATSTSPTASATPTASRSSTRTASSSSSGDRPARRTASSTA